MSVRQIIQPAFSFLIMFTGLSANSADVLWNAPFGGEFSEPTNWLGGSAPVWWSDNAVFDLSLTGYVVDVTMPTTTQGLIIRDDTVTLELNGYTYDVNGWTFDGNGVVVGQGAGDVGNLNVTNGSLNSFSTIIAESSGSSGAINISGPGAAMTGDPVLIIGGGGNGQFTVENGGTMLGRGTHVIGRDSGATGSLMVTGAGSLSSSYELFIGYDGQGNVAVNDAGQLITIDSFIGANTGSNGMVLVEGEGSEWMNQLNMYIGSNSLPGSGNGQLHVLNGGVVNTITAYVGGEIGSTGTVIVNGTGSSFNVSGIETIVGQKGEGFIEVTGGASLSTQHIILGQDSTASGILKVDGIGSIIDANGFDIRVGVNGSGNLSILNGATVHAYSTNVSGSSGVVSKLVVDGVGTTFNSSIFAGRADIFVNNGATVQSIVTSISGDAGYVTQVSVDGPGTRWKNSGLVEIGLYGKAHMTISNGAEFSSDSATNMGWYGGSNGVVEINDANSSFKTNTLNVGIDGEATFEINDGNADVDASIEIGKGGRVALNGGVLSSGDIDPGQGVFEFNGGKLNANIFYGDLDNKGGTVDPGQIGGLYSAGLLEVTGSYTQDLNSIVSIDIGGTLRAQEYQQIIAYESASLAGLLQIDLVNSFNPIAGDYFDLLHANSIFGNFDGLMLPNLGKGLSWEVLILDDVFLTDFETYRLSVVSSVPLPASVWLFGSGFLAFLHVARRKKLQLKQ